jgi:hypothetical protein
MDTSAAARPNVTRYDLPRHLTRIKHVPGLWFPEAMVIDEASGHVWGASKHNDHINPTCPTMEGFAFAWGLDLDELTAVLSGWAPTHRLTHGGAVYLVMLAGDGTGDAFTGREWAEGDLPRWMRDEAGRWFERDFYGDLAARDGVRVEVLVP